MDSILEKLRNFPEGSQKRELTDYLDEVGISYTEEDDVIETGRLDYDYDTDCKVISFEYQSDILINVEEIF